MKSSAPRTRLDGMIVEIELTLVSIIQGVAFTFLIENARHVASIEQAIFWPYVINGLLVILVFWSRSVLHIITLIRWPLEFGHNFLYIACALVEALLFTQLSNPFAWFVFGAIYTAIGWSLFVYDLRLLRARERDSAGAASNRLYALIRRDQRRNILVLLPAVFLFNVICAFCIRTWPELFLAGNAHGWLAAAQFVAFGCYLLCVVRFYVNLAPLILESHQEWHGGA
jgi:hypothetical protein